MENFTTDIEVINAKYEWKQQISERESITFNNCSCFSGYCQSKTINGTFVKCCNNKASIKDYIDATCKIND